MVRNLAAQAEAIWPQELPIVQRHPVGRGRVLDVGCGTGEITARLAELWPEAQLVGVDVEESHLVRARERCASDRVEFRFGDAMALPFDDDEFDLVVCRHLLQAVPDPKKVISEIRRVTKPGGRVHLIAEDYGMLWCFPTELNADDFWQKTPWVYEKGVGCDLHVGRKTYTLLRDADMNDIAVDYVVVDTIRVPRDTFARIWEAWRDGYTDSIVEHTGVPREEIERRWREMIDCVRDDRGYALWQVPVWTAAKPA